MRNLLTGLAILIIAMGMFGCSNKGIDVYDSGRIVMIGGEELTITLEAEEHEATIAIRDLLRLRKTIPGAKWRNKVTIDKEGNVHIGWNAKYYHINKIMTKWMRMKK